MSDILSDNRSMQGLVLRIYFDHTYRPFERKLEQIALTHENSEHSVSEIELSFSSMNPDEPCVLLSDIEQDGAVDCWAFLRELERKLKEVKL